MHETRWRVSCLRDASLRQLTLSDIRSSLTSWLVSRTGFVVSLLDFFIVVTVVVASQSVPIWGGRCPEEMRNSTRFT